MLPLISDDPRLHLADRLDVRVVVPGRWLLVGSRQVVAVVHVREGALRAARLRLPIGLSSFVKPIGLYCERVPLVVDLFEVYGADGLLLGRQAHVLLNLL